MVDELREPGSTSRQRQKPSCTEKGGGKYIITSYLLYGRKSLKRVRTTEETTSGRADRVVLGMADGFPSLCHRRPVYRRSMGSGLTRRYGYSMAF